MQYDIYKVHDIRDIILNYTHAVEISLKKINVCFKEMREVQNVMIVWNYVYVLIGSVWSTVNGI